MFVRIQIIFMDHFESYKRRIFDVQIEVKPYLIETLNLHHSIEIHKCLPCYSGTIIYDQ